MLEIRKYEKKDFKDVQYVCLNSDGGGMDETTREVVLHLFCDYYLENEPQNCFVLSDGGKAVGYVFCCESYDKFEPVYEKSYKPLVLPIGGWFVGWAEEAYLLHKELKDEYPAHLHIDILPEYQRGGWGGKLIEALLCHLKEKNIGGVMLTTGTGNELACNFYKKRNFDILKIQGTDIAFGKKIL